MEELFEEIFINSIELEEVQKMMRSEKFQYPVIYFGKNYCCFNTFGTKLVKNYIKWFTTSEYVIGIPANAGAKNAYKVCHSNRNTVVAAFPVVLRKEKKILCGYYKLYKYKDGFAFKRYEPINLEKA